MHDYNIKKDWYIDKLQLKKYNSTYHKTLKMKPTDINPRMYMDFN